MWNSVPNLVVLHCCWLFLFCWKLKKLNDIAVTFHPTQVNSPGLTPARQAGTSSSWWRTPSRALPYWRPDAKYLSPLPSSMLCEPQNSVTVSPPQSFWYWWRRNVVVSGVGLINKVIWCCAQLVQDGWPSWYVTSHLDQLRLPSLRGR